MSWDSQKWITDPFWANAQHGIFKWGLFLLRFRWLGAWGQLGQCFLFVWVFLLFYNVSEQYSYCTVINWFSMLLFMKHLKVLTFQKGHLALLPHSKGFKSPGGHKLFCSPWVDFSGLLQLPPTVQRPAFGGIQGPYIWPWGVILSVNGCFFIYEAAERS